MSITNQQECGTPEKKEILGLDGKPLDTENLLKIPERRIHYQQNPDSICPDKRELKHIPVKGNIINPVFLVKNNAIYDN